MRSQLYLSIFSHIQYLAAVDILEMEETLYAITDRSVEGASVPKHRVVRSWRSTALVHFPPIRFAEFGIDA
mgnify:CR=1 FL=1